MRAAWLGFVACVLACGAKTALLAGGPGGGGGTSGGASGGTTGPLAVTCPAALQSGAPTPTLGFCSTRSNQATQAAPRAPQIAWTAQPFAIPDPEDYLPAQVVVDASGRSYVLVNASPLNAEGGPNRLTAIDPDGTVAWRATFPSPASGLSIAADGTIWALAGQLYAYSRDGAPTATLDVSAAQPDGGPPPSGFAFDQIAIGDDGTFFLAGYEGGGVEHITDTGAALWSGGGEQFQNGIIGVTSNDGIVLGGGESDLVAFSPDGAMMWTNESPLEFGIDANDDVVGLVGELGSDQAQLLVLDAAGEGLRSVLLPSQTFNATALALAADGTEVALLANEISSPGLTKSHVVVSAVDAEGTLRWSTPFDETLVYDPADLTTHYAVFVDAAGTVVVTAGNITALDLASGAVLWTLAPAAPRQCLRPVVLGANGSLVGTQCDGTVFLAR